MQERTLLLAVTGMSPAVITETLYGIDRNGDAWPKEIQVITTSKGKGKVAEGLIADKQIEKLCKELGKPMIPFSDQHIKVVPNADGNPVEDARNLEDHEALANFIMTTVRDLAADMDTRIHASIAGGRKTMTFYLGYAMSLFGRHFDQLSHVLVGEDSEVFERCSDFFFPTRNDHSVHERNGKVHNAKDASIILADIPFIRQRSVVPDLMKGVEGRINFRRLIDLINLGDQPDKIKLHVYEKDARLVLTGRHLDTLAEIEFPNFLHWSLYLLLLEDTLADDREEYTAFNKKEHDETFGNALLLKLLDVLKKNNYLIDDIDEKDFDTLSNSLYEALDCDSSKMSPGFKRSLGALTNTGFTGSTFRDYLAAIKRTFTFDSELPVNLAAHINPQQISQTLSEEELEEHKEKERKDVARKEKREFVSRRTTKTGKKGGQYYIVPLPNPQRQIVVHSD